ncbi:biotin transporter BioY [Clostridiaceae bacterium]|nr:biotin transporter BioY [Clostridiaceae bacterium]
MEKSMSAGTENKKLFSTGQMALIGMMTAVTCILGPLVIPLPISPVPISFTNLAVYLAVYVLGTKAGTISYLVYLLLGFAGLPVFSGFTGGIVKLAGPTGGYLAGFIFMALISGWAIERFPGRYMIQAAGMILGTAVCYVFGTVWLAGQLGIGFAAGLGVGVIPYLPGDAVKILFAVMIGSRVRREIRRVMER